MILNYSFFYYNINSLFYLKKCPNRFRLMNFKLEYCARCNDYYCFTCTGREDWCIKCNSFKPTIHEYKCIAHVINIIK